MAEIDPFAEARALLMQFARSELKAMRVATAALEVACSRDPEIRIASLARPASETPSRDGVEQVLTAPHIGTLAWIVPVGTAIAAGEAYATLSLLDDEIALLAGIAGTLERHHGQPGALIEFGAPIATLVH